MRLIRWIAVGQASLPAWFGRGVPADECPLNGRQGRLPPRNQKPPSPYLLPLRPRRLPVPMASGPGRCSEFFDPKVRGNPPPIAILRGKSGHHRAGCRASFTASAGGTLQGGSTDSVTENIPPDESSRFEVGVEEQSLLPGLVPDSCPARVKRWSKSPPRFARAGRHEKPHPVQGKIGGWTARPIATGMLHPPALFGATEGETGASPFERNDDRSTARCGTESGLPAPKLTPPQGQAVTGDG